MIRYADAKDFKGIKNLFNACFPEDISFNNYFFDNIYSHKRTFVYEENGKLCSMVQSIPYFIKGLGNVSYIYGACTEENSRGKGLMSKLLQKTFEEDNKNNICASILIPQDGKSALFDFYKHFGYETAFFLESKIIQKNSLKSSLCLKKSGFEDIPVLNGIYTEALNGISYIDRSIEYWKKQILLFNALNGNAFIIAEKNKPLGYAFCWDAPTPIAQEIFVSDKSYIQSAINLIADFYNKNEVKTTLSSDSVPFGCIKYHKKANHQKGFYMNLMYN